MDPVRGDIHTRVATGTVGFVFLALTFSRGSLALWSQTNQAALNCSEYPIVTVSFAFFIQFSSILFQLILVFIQTYISIQQAK